MSTRSGRTRPSAVESSPPRTRKGVSPPRSPGRTRKSSPRGQSPSRKSPSRKSPSRKPASKFPARKSPSRTTKATNETSPQKSPVKRAPVKTNVEIRLEDITRLDNFRSSRGRRTEYSIKDLSAGILESEFAAGDRVNGVESKDNYGLRNRKFAEDIIPRRSSRLKDYDSASDIQRSMSKSESKSISQSLDAYSDTESSEDLGKSKSTARKLATPLRDSVTIGSRWEFGGRIGSILLIILLPLTVFSIVLSCTKSCSINSLLNVSKYKSLSFWFSPLPFTAITVQYFLQAVFSCLPILGTKSERQVDSSKKYSFNAFFSCVVTLILVFMLDYFKVFDSNILLHDYFKLSLTSYAYAVVLSIFLYNKRKNIDSAQLNPYGNTGFVVYDYWMGREIHPHIKHLNVKIWISRVCNINTLILAILIFKHGIRVPLTVADDLSLETYKELLSNTNYKPTILLFSMMQVIYVLNFIMREYKVTTTFFWQYEGVGYLQLVSSALYPFYFTTISKFLAANELALSTNMLIAASLLYVAGFVIMLVSNNLKHEFRNNPLHPSLKHLESMPTFHGKKLLISNIWGLLRHPNYTGDILIHLALAIPGIVLREFIVSLPALLTILVLLHRAFRDHTRCQRRYGAAWQRYCKRVPSVIIPKIV